MISSASFSGCGRYRYRLVRQWDDQRPTIAWIMLNPSAADADVDDPTIRKCVGFTKRSGCGGIVVVNLFAWRATNPRDLPADALVSPMNDFEVGRAMRESDAVVAAWGSASRAPKRAKYLARQLAEKLDRYAATLGHPLHCLGATRDGNPRHPLMVSYDTPFRPWEFT